VVLAHRLVEVELAFHFARLHHLVVVFMPDFFLQELVSSVFLGVGAHVARILSLNASEVEDLSLFLIRLSIGPNLAPSRHRGRISRRKDPRSEIFGVKDTHFLLVDKNKE